MIYPLERIIYDVRVAMNAHYRTDGHYEVDDEATGMLDRAIEHRIEQCADAAIMRAEPVLLGGGRSFADAIATWETEHRGRVVLPDDFCRLLTFRMSDWQHSVATPTAVDSDAYAMLYSGVGGVMADTEHPQVVIQPAPTGLCIYHYGSASSEAEVMEAQYLPITRIEESEGTRYVDIPQGVYPMVVDMIAQVLGVTQASLMQDKQ